jgi:hypothetical protein
MAYDDDAFANQAVCKVYDADDFFTVAVQMLLAVAALLSLWFKRMGETPRRTFRTWSLDIGKQAVGACYAHVCNMVGEACGAAPFPIRLELRSYISRSLLMLFLFLQIIAGIIINKIRGDATLDDQCAWYGICYLVDTTLGLVLAIFLLKALDQVAQERDWVSLKHSGVYEGVDGYLHWTHQVLAWVVVLTIVKVIIYFFMILFSEMLAVAGALLFAPLQGNIRFELVFVMIVFPGFLNLIYFWIADSYLQAKAEHAGAHEEDPEETELATKKEGLLSDDEKAEADPKTWSNVDSAGGSPPSTMV